MSIDSLRGAHPGQTGQIVGKGPSLKYLTGEHFGPGPVLALNDAIIAVEWLGLSNPLYSLQKDGNPHHMTRPGDDVTLILQSTPGYSSAWFPEHPQRLLVDPRAELHFADDSVMSIRMGAAILRLMGCEQMVFISCDSLASDDLRTYYPRTGKTKKRCAAMYAAVIPLLFSDLEGFPYRVFTPERRPE
jgi:hypothetical protein